MSYVDQTIGEIFDYEEPTEQLFGVEVEVEGAGVSSVSLEGWTTTRDSSLRGESAEFVFRRPSNIAATNLLVSALYAGFRTNQVRLNDTMRAGMHLHIDTRLWTVKQVATFLTAYWLIEDVLIKNFAGEDRFGNAFCLPLSTSDDVLWTFIDLVRGRNLGIVRDMEDSIKYSAMNIATLGKYGSIESRSLRSPMQDAPMLRWISIFNNLCVGSQEFSSPLALIDAISGTSSEAVLRGILGPSFSLFDGLYTNRDIVSAARRVQPLAFEINWS